MEAGHLNVDNEIITKDKHGNASDFKSQKCGRDKSPLKSRRKDNDTLPRQRELMDMEDQKDIRDNQLRGTMAQNIVPAGDINLFEKETKVYAQKKATQCEVPELIVYLKETSNHAVNIRFDDEKPSFDKPVVENKGANHNSPLRFSSVHGDLIKVIMEDLESNSDAMVEHNTENLMEDDKDKFNFTDKLRTFSCSEKFVSKDELSARGLETVKIQSEAPFNDDEDMQQSDQILVLDTYKEVELSSSSLMSAAEAINCRNNVQETSSNVCLESDSVIINPGSSPRLESVISEEQKHSELVHTLETPTVEDSLGELRSDSSRSFLTQHGHRESSFSAVDNPTALVTRSGQIAYSGNISLRSDSSTTSTRSFAFPILQSDWPTSPVRMAKADRRHYRKHQRWKLSFLCCRF